MKKFLNSKNIFLVAGFLGLFLFSCGISFAVFKFVLKRAEPEPTVTPQVSEQLKKEGFLVDTTGPKTEVCPITGEKFTVQEKNSWSQRRPLAVMIENHLDARPQSGLSFADVVYEAVAEGGITRFMGVFYCNAQAKEAILGPIRSARTYFLDWASEYGKYPLYAHVGGANTPGPANALGQIEQYGWGGSQGNDLNQFSIGYPTFWRDYERMGRTVLTEHTMYSTTERLWGVGKSRGFTNLSTDKQNWLDDFTPWKFDTQTTPAGDKTKISFEFWKNSPDYSVVWELDKTLGMYKRLNGSESHEDLDINQQLAAKTVIVQFMKESSANDGYENNVHLLYGTTGQGKALIFSNGNVVQATWNKKTRLDRTKYLDNLGKEIKFQPGKIWIETLPVGNEVNY